MVIYVMNQTDSVVELLGSIGQRLNARVKQLNRAESVVYEVSPTEVSCLITDTATDEMQSTTLLEKLDEAKIRVPVIVLTEQTDVETAVELMKAGALDVMLLPINETELECCVQTGFAISRKRIQAQEKRESYQQQLDRLSRRERQVIDYLLKGATNKEIAYELSLSEKTIAAHRSNALQKMDVDSIQELLKASILTGMSA